MRRVLILLTMVSACLYGFANSSIDLQQADSAYIAQNFKKAISLYEKCLSAGTVSSEIYYNLGNSYYKTDDFGKAVLNFNRALKENPSNENARNNLTYLRSKISDLNKAELKGKKGDIEIDEPSFGETIYNSIAKNVHSNTWAVLSVISFILMITSIATYIFVQNVLMRKIGFFGGAGLLIATIIFISFSFVAASEYENSDTVVVTSFKVSLKSDAKDSADNVSIPFHRGTEFEILEKIEDVNNDVWYKVRLNNDVAGWVKINDVEEL